LENTARGKTSIAGEDSRLETMMIWAGAGHWAVRWAARGWVGKATGKEKKKEEWVGLRKQSNRLGGKGKCFLFSKPFINCKLF
jgi:hypothetical protein